MKKWYTSRTIWIAILTSVMGLIVAFDSQYPGIGFLMIFKSFIDVVLRFITTTEIK